MTLLALPKAQEVWRPSPGYLLAGVQDTQSAEKSQKVAVKAADKYWEEWWAKCDATKKRQVPPPPPAGRLARYQNKPTMEAPPVPPLPTLDAKQQIVMVEQPQPPRTGSWAGQKVDFPKDYEHAMADWIQLEPISPRRDQVLREIAGIEIMMTAEQGMAEPPAVGLPPPTSGVAGELPELPWSGAPPAPV